MRVALLLGQKRARGEISPIPPRAPAKRTNPETKSCGSLSESNQPMPRLELGTFALQVRRINHFATSAVIDPSCNFVVICTRVLSAFSCFGTVLRCAPAADSYQPPEQQHQQPKTMAMLLSRTLRTSGVSAFAPLQAAVRTHCQVPCGIFDDPARVSELKEDAATIRKAMVQIAELGSGDAQSFNQVRRRYTSVHAVHG